jgi:hypothetical protein
LRLTKALCILPLSWGNLKEVSLVKLRGVSLILLSALLASACLKQDLTTERNDGRLERGDALEHQNGDSPSEDTLTGTGTRTPNPGLRTLPSGLNLFTDSQFFTRPEIRPDPSYKLYGIVDCARSTYWMPGDFFSIAQWGENRNDTILFHYKNVQVSAYYTNNVIADYRFQVNAGTTPELVGYDWVDFARPEQSAAYVFPDTYWYRGNHPRELWTNDNYSVAYVFNGAAFMPGRVKFLTGEQTGTEYGMWCAARYPVSQLNNPNPDPLYSRLRPVWSFFMNTNPLTGGR